MASHSSKKRKLEEGSQRQDAEEGAMAPLTVVEQLRLDPMFGFNICDSKTDSKELKDIEHILEKAHGIVRSQRILKSSGELQGCLQQLRPLPGEEDEDAAAARAQYKAARYLASGIALIHWDESSDAATSPGSGFGSGQGCSVTSRSVSATFHLRSRHNFVAEIRFHSEWDFDDYHSNGSSIVSISGPDDNTLYSISDDFACDYGDSPILNTSRGECDPDAIDSVLEVLDIDIKRSVFMTVLATSMEVLLKDRLSDSDSSPIIQGGCLTELVSDAFDGLDD